MMNSSSPVVDRFQSPYTLPSPPADFDELEFSADNHCWPSHSDLCRSVHNSHAVEPPRGHHLSSIDQSPRFSLYRCRVGCIYPSPPATGSQATEHVPLPDEADNLPSIYTVVDAGGILDSPLAIRKIPHTHIPLSPPPTIPTTTQALPEAELGQTNPRDGSDRPALPSPESDHEDLFSPADSEGDSDHDERREAVSDESDPGGALEPLLSPLSPEWSTKISNLSSTCDESDSLSEPPSLTFGTEHREFINHDHEPCSGGNNFLGSHLRGNFCSGSNSILSSPGMTMELAKDTGNSTGSSPPDESSAEDDIPGMLDFPLSHPMDEADDSWHPEQLPEQQNEWSSWINDHDPPDHTGPSAVDLGDPPNTDLCIISDPTHRRFSHFPPSHSRRTVPPTLDIPHAQHTLTPTTHSDSKSFGYTYRPDEAFRMDVDDEESPGASSSSHRPDSVRPFLISSFRDEFHDSSLPPTRFGDPFLHMSPSLRAFPSLPDFQDDLGILPASPSPSRRSFSTLPALEDEEDIFRHPSSPNQTLLSLPGSETDDDLLPPFSSDVVLPEFYQQTPRTPSHGLMLMDDHIEDLGYGQRSPSPELFDIDLDLDDDIYPEFEQLCELRKKALSAEREARTLESQLLEQGAFARRAETRRLRKREKERAKEIGALLRLKLGNDKVAILQEEERKPKKMATSLPRLVAQMVFRRHDSNRPLASRQLISDSMTLGYVPSSLSHPVSSDLQQ